MKLSEWIAQLLGGPSARTHNNPELPPVPFREHPAIIAARAADAKPEHFGKRVRHEPGAAPPPGQVWAGDYSSPHPQARANAWKTHDADTLRFAIAYALQMANANGDNCGVRWLRAWSEGSPAALAELRAALAHGEIPY